MNEAGEPLSHLTGHFVYYYVTEITQRDSEDTSIIKETSSIHPDHINIH